MSMQIDEHFYQSLVQMLNYVTYLEKMDFSLPGAYVVVECCAHSPSLPHLVGRFFPFKNSLEPCRLQNLSR